jgi:uncharacterized OB-fold protein
MEEYAKPLPEITEGNRPFWEGLRERILRMQRCSNCGHLRYPISEWCPRCLEESCEWAALTGRGEVASTIVFHQVYDKAFAGDVPYNVSLIQLDEGPRIFSNVVDVPPSDVAVGDRVEIVFDDVTDGVTLPRFRPVRSDEETGTPA